MIASPKTSATLRTSSFFGNFLDSTEIVSATTNLVIGDFSIDTEAWPERTGWVQQARTSLAPLSLIATAALVKVPAVSTMSSRIMAVRPSTSPTIFITSDRLGDGLRLSTIAKLAFKSLANVRTILTEPTSGATTTKGPFTILEK